MSIPSPNKNSPDVLARNILLGSSLLLLATLVYGLPQAPPTTSPVDPKAAGATLFHESGCEHCHGANMRGTERGPDLSSVGRRLTKDQIEHQIHEGGKEMPSFSDALDSDQISNLVAFLQTKRAPVKKTTKSSRSTH